MYKFMCVSVPTSHHSHEGSTVSSPYIPPPPDHWLSPDDPPAFSAFSTSWSYRILILWPHAGHCDLLYLVCIYTCCIYPGCPDCAPPERGLHRAGTMDIRIRQALLQRDYIYQSTKIKNKSSKKSLCSSDVQGVADGRCPLLHSLHPQPLCHRPRQVSTVQYRTVQYSTVQYSTVQYRDNIILNCQVRL